MVNKYSQSPHGVNLHINLDIGNILLNLIVKNN